MLVVLVACCQLILVLPYPLGDTIKCKIFLYRHSTTKGRGRVRVTLLSARESYGRDGAQLGKRPRDIVDRPRHQCVSETPSTNYSMASLLFDALEL